MVEENGGRSHWEGSLLKCDVKNIEKGPEPFSWKMVGVEKLFLKGVLQMDNSVGQSKS